MCTKRPDELTKMLLRWRSPNPNSKDSTQLDAHDRMNVCWMSLALVLCCVSIKYARMLLSRCIEASEWHESTNSTSPLCGLTGMMWYVSKSSSRSAWLHARVKYCWQSMTTASFHTDSALNINTRFLVVLVLLSKMLHRTTHGLVALESWQALSSSRDTTRYRAEPGSSGFALLLAHLSPAVFNELLACALRLDWQPVVELL
jgi:hypothetical protein